MIDGYGNQREGKATYKAIVGRICITTSEPLESASGQYCRADPVRTVSLSDGYSEMTGLAEGVYIVVLEDGTCVKMSCYSKDDCQMI